MKTSEAKNKNYASRMGKKHPCFMCDKEYFKSLLTEVSLKGIWEWVCSDCFYKNMK